MQCDVDVIGTDSVVSDAEVIACLCRSLEVIGITNYVIQINDRRVLKDLSQDAIRILDKVQKIGVDGMVNEMRERKVSSTQIEIAKQLVETNNPEIPERLNQVIELLNQYNLQGQVKFDPTIARGLDYYSGTVFEIILADKPEYGSICSGGRYDGLLDQFSKQSLPAVGGSIGIDRLLSAMDELGLNSDNSAIKAIILNLDNKLMTEYVKLAQQLRSQGVATEIYYQEVKLEKQFKYAEQKNIQYAILIGEQENSKDMAQLKNIKTREQDELPQSELIQQLSK
jgi:histidyl-tRNA synthetase